MKLQVEHRSHNQESLQNCKNNQEKIIIYKLFWYLTNNIGVLHSKLEYAYKIIETIRQNMKIMKPENLMKYWNQLKKTCVILKYDLNIRNTQHKTSET